MNLRHKLKGSLTLDQIFENYFSSTSYASGDDLYLLVDLVHLIRPKNPNKIDVVSIATVLTF
jgi:hypothetical protein